MILTRLGCVCLMISTIRRKGALGRRPRIAWRRLRWIAPWWASSISVAIISVAEDMPQAPADDPVVPPTVGRDSTIVPPSGLRRCGIVNALDLSVSGRLCYHGGRVWTISNLWIILALWCEVAFVLNCTSSTSCCLFLSHKEISMQSGIGVDNRESHHHHLIQTLVTFIALVPSHALEELCLRLAL